MKLQCKQITLAEIYPECHEIFLNDKPKFLELLSELLDLRPLIPVSFYTSYYNYYGRSRKYSLLSMLSIFLLQKILNIPTISLLRIILSFSSELRDYCGIRTVPDDAQFTRFKQSFLSQLENMFNHLVDITEPICQNINSILASSIAFDTTGIEAFATENNNKHLNSIIKRLKAKYKDKSIEDVHKIAYSTLPKYAS